MINMYTYTAYNIYFTLSGAKIHVYVRYQSWNIVWFSNYIKKMQVNVLVIFKIKINSLG